MAALLRTLRARASTLFTTYKGIWSRRRATVRTYDPDTGELESTQEMVLLSWQYFYKAPVRKVVTCKVDGQRADPDACKSKGNPKAMYPLLDRNSARHYRITLMGQTMVAHQPCYKLKVTPRHKTERHFSGTLYVALGTLKPVRAEGTLARLPFPIKRFHIKLRFTQYKGFAVPSSGKVEITLKVPVVYHARLVSSFHALEHRLIPR